MSLTDKELRKLQGVDPRLVAVCADIRARGVQCRIFEGLRTEKRQRYLVSRGRSRTLDSQHLVGKAVDVVPWVDGRLRWLWPACHQVAAAFRASWLLFGFDPDELEWGGSWENFPDGVHYQLREGVK